MQYYTLALRLLILFVGISRSNCSIKMFQNLRNCLPISHRSLTKSEPSLFRLLQLKDIRQNIRKFYQRAHTDTANGRIISSMLKFLTERTDPELLLARKHLKNEAKVRFFFLFLRRIAFQFLESKPTSVFRIIIRKYDVLSCVITSLQLRTG